LPRIPYFDLDQAPPEYLEAVGTVPAMNLFRMLPYAGRVAPAFLRMGGMILNRTVLDPQLRELAILRVGALTGSEYEVHHHRRIGGEAGLSPGAIDATALGADASALTPVQRQVVVFTDAVVKEIKAPDVIFDSLLEDLGANALSELVLTIGYYLMVARFLINFGVEVEAPAA
jgi:alkylhydroperoxidase family enzyme